MKKRIDRASFIHDQRRSSHSRRYRQTSFALTRMIVGLSWAWSAPAPWRPRDGLEEIEPGFREGIDEFRQERPAQVRHMYGIPVSGRQSLSCPSAKCNRKR